MASSGREDGFGDDGRRDEASDHLDWPPPPLDGDSPDAPVEPDDSASDLPRSSAGASSSFADRLRDVLRGESDGGAAWDGDEGMIRWLRALDLQVLGACRADERLKPLLKLNVSSGAAEDRLLAQLSQHFEASEVGMLARYLCVPLVSIRVGKVTKEGSLLCPTSARGQLNLNLLPSSNMRLSFSGDDGHTERLALVTNDLDSCYVVIDEISADISGRSFLVKLPDSRIFYYWCSEKSKLHGMELLAKMKDLLRSRPCLSFLTGISRLRLDLFATHLKAYVLEISKIAEASLSASSNGSLFNPHAHGSDRQSSCMAPNLTCLGTAAFTGTGHSLGQGSLIPKLSATQDGRETTLSLTGKGASEMLEQHAGSNLSPLTISSSLFASVSAGVANTACTSLNVDNKLSDFGSSEPLQSCLPEIPSLPSPLLFNPMPVHLPPFQPTVPSLRFSPYYCWCPPCPSSVQFAMSPSLLQPVSSESMPLPSLSMLLSVTGPKISSVPSKLPIDVGHQAVISDPLFPVALPVSSLNLTGSQHIPTFVPFMADPIVHIPVVGVCSSGQGYLVSAGPTMSSAIPPLLPGFVNPLISKTESSAEKSARETLQMLLASGPSPFSSHRANLCPVVFNDVDSSISCANVSANTSVALEIDSFCDRGTPNMRNAANGLSFTISDPGTIVDQEKTEPSDISSVDDPPV